MYEKHDPRAAFLGYSYEESDQENHNILYSYEFLTPKYFHFILCP